MQVRFCFELSAEAKMAVDENNNPTSCLVTFALNVAKLPTPERYKELHALAREAAAEQLKFPIEWFTPITEEEYDRRSAESEEDIVV